MKEVLKVLPTEFEMKYDEVFNSQENKKIRAKLIPEILRSLRPRYNPSYIQLKGWLRSLHKHRRDGYLLLKKEQDRANKRSQNVHSTNRITEVQNSFITNIQRFYI